MNDKKGSPGGDIGTGSLLLHIDETILTAGEVRPSEVITTRSVSKIGIDIRADQACSVKVTRMPDGETDGAVSDIGTVIAGTPAFFLYSSLLCPGVKVTVTSTSGTDMTDFSMRVRGGA